MSVWDRIRDYIAPVKPKGRTQVVANENKKDPFNPKKRDRAQLLEYKTIYEQGGVVTEGFRCIALTAFANGYRFEGEDESMVALVEERVEMLDLDQVGPQAFIDALVFGDSIQEKGFGSGEYSDQIVALLPRPAWTFDIDYDETGTIHRYIQRVPKGSGLEEKEIVLEPRRIFHFTIDVLGGNPYGIPLMKTAYDDIMRDTIVSEGLANAIKRHGTPKYHVRIGAEGEDVEESFIHMVSNQLKELNSKNEMVTTYDVVIENIDKEGITNTKLYGDWATQKLCAAIGVPEEFLGLGRGSTEATANVRLKAFYDKISQHQRRFAKMFSRQVIDDITGRPGEVYMVFNEPSPTDLAQIADTIMKIMANPLDPELIISVQEARDMLGFDEARDIDYEEDFEDAEQEA